MSTRTAVAVAQWGPGADRDVNLAELRELAQKAVDLGAGLVVFPEYSAYFTPRPDEGWVANAEPLDGPFVSALSAIAAELEVIIVAGLLEQSSQPEKCRNTIVAVGTDGALLATSPSPLRTTIAWLSGAVCASESVARGGEACEDQVRPKRSRMVLAL